ncbi:hypothetical protein F4813DRAFT_392712 [Daldinia decipiens]|uniref:uncharacterized protein n=1 Tax=Daldinia decipiens TaxID=326647 RepID=UPI0020C3C94A|nr:uncharacterized protein F4813DRAFT_392712 [Daldinia decipiens]KAI1654460.1 hypothetical protein F4813DRAFT_392712 [Daldinia decipiens]
MASQKPCHTSGAKMKRQRILVNQKPFSIRTSLCEAAFRDGKEPSGPSWVLDFVYSNASHRTCNSARKVSDRETLDGYLFQKQVTRIQSEDATKSVCYATPTTLFCTGYFIDQVSGVGEILSVDEDPVKYMVDFILSIYLTRQSILGLAVPSDYINNLMKGDSETSLMFYSWLDLFTLQQEDHRLGGDIKELYKTQNLELAGKDQVLAYLSFPDCLASLLNQAECWYIQVGPKGV